MMETWKAPDNKIFIFSQVFPFYVIGPASTDYPKGYWFCIEGEKAYKVPMEVAAVANKKFSKENKTMEQRWIDLLTIDAYTDSNGVFDLVSAVKDFYGFDIKSKPFGDQTDYEISLELINKILERERDDNPEVSQDVRETSSTEVHSVDESV